MEFFIAFFLGAIACYVIQKNASKRDSLPSSVPADHVVNSPSYKKIVQLQEEKKKQEREELPHDFELSDEFQSAFLAIENTNSNFYLTGDAGAGKTTFLKYFRQKTKKKHIVLAPTGIAALNSSGQTIHSFFKFPPKLIQADHVRALSNQKKIFENLGLLIIDEVSMVRADMLDAIDLALRVNRESELPFGGVQILLIGDMYQLPPVVDKELAEHFPKLYVSRYFFSAKSFNRLKLQRIHLQKIYRQKDGVFKELLNKVRHNKLSDQDLARINDRVTIAVESRGDCITLTPTNDLANSINRERLSRLTTKERVYEACVIGDFDESSYPTEYYLKLKVGAQILMIKNDPDKRWVNGSLGQVIELDDDEIRVRIEDRICHISPMVWEKLKYRYDEQLGKIVSDVVGSFEQLPLKLAWAITIHKSQGLTFDRVVIDMGNGAFETGQCYVALSRCRTFENLFLNKPISFKDIRLDKKIVDFEESFLKIELNNLCVAEAGGGLVDKGPH